MYMIVFVYDIQIVNCKNLSIDLYKEAIMGDDYYFTEIKKLQEDKKWIISKKS